MDDLSESLPVESLNDEKWSLDSAPAQIWAEADKDNYKSLKIDGFLSKLVKQKKKLPPHHSLDDAKKIARRGLEIGHLAALQAKRGIPGPIVDDFEDIEKLATKSARALTDLIEHLQPGALKPNDLRRAMLTMKVSRQVLSPTKLQFQAAKDASILWECRELVRRLEARASERAVLVRKGRHNPGKPEHAAFLRELAEVWIYLTGKRPSSNVAHDTNPFLRFAKLAWSDVFDPEERVDLPDFVGALRKLPKWNDYDLSQLKERGPVWL